MDMMADIKKHVKDPNDEEALTDYLNKILDKKAFDNSGLIYGMGHAIYTKSDPRAKVFKSLVEELALEKNRTKDYTYYKNIEKIATGLIMAHKHNNKSVCANVDFYSGFVYDMMDIPKEVFTPLFATARIVGWSAHRIEELITSNKILRPAYINIHEPRDYVPIEKR
jgi:citrate synthase